MMRMYRSPGRSGPLCHESAPAHQVVGRRAEGEEPIDESSAAMTEFAQQSDRLQPTERLLNELPLAMTVPIARVSSRARVDRAAAIPEFVLGDVWRDVHPSD